VLRRPGFNIPERQVYVGMDILRLHRRMLHLGALCARTKRADSGARDNLLRTTQNNQRVRTAGTHAVE
jgi:hypothetical protein